MRIVVSFRHEDEQSAPLTERVLRKLREAFGEDCVREHTPVRTADAEFHLHTRKELEHCDALVVVIGADWLGAGLDSASEEPAHYPDPVRLVIEVALELELPIVPLLLEDTAFPARSRLPSTISALDDFVRHQVSTEDFNLDMSAVITGLAALPRTSTAAIHQPSEQTEVDVLDDDVQFTAFRPRDVLSSEWHTLLVFAHRAELPGEHDPMERVRETARRILGEEEIRGYIQSTEESSASLPRYGEITLVPSVAQVSFNPARRTFRWTEPVHHESFRFQTTAPAGSILRGRLAVHLGAILIAEINLRFRVTSGVAEAAGQTSERNSARRYRRIFASYSHSDTEIVDQFERYVHALGDSYLRDVTTLRAGEKWNPRLLELIEHADVFQLFWSHNSMVSPFVRQEWEHALSLQRPAFVRPTYWEDPMPEGPGLPPEELKELHFSRLTVAPAEEPRPTEPPDGHTRPSPPSDDSPKTLWWRRWPLVFGPLAVLSLVLLLPILQRHPGHPPLPHPPRGDIVDTAVGAGSFNTLVTAVKAAGLVDTLKGEGPFTVFVPTDKAFAKLPVETLSALLQDKAALTQVLTYHVVPGRILSSDLQPGMTKKVATANGQELTVRVDRQGNVMVDGAKVVSTDILADNGIIHVIDNVILPD